MIAQVRDELIAWATQARRPPEETAKRLHKVEQEIANVKLAVRLGRATEILLEMLEDAERRRRALLAGQEASGRDDLQVRLEKVLAELPERSERT